MGKFEWMWIPQGFLCILGVLIIAIPLIVPMTEDLKIIIILAGSGLFILGLSLEEVIKVFKFMKGWLTRRKP